MTELPNPAYMDSFQEELPIFLLIFLFPAAVAIFAKWKFL